MPQRKGRSAAVAATLAALALTVATAVTGHPRAAERTTAAGRPLTAASPARPFPSHVTYRTGVTPSASRSARDAAVKKQYDSWKSHYLRAACGGYLVHAT